MISIFLLQKFNQLKSRIAKLEQQLSKFSCCFKRPKPFNQPDKTYIIAVRDIFNKAKQKVIDTEDIEVQKYLKSNECSSFLNDLLSIFSKTIFQKIIEEKNKLHKSLIQWLKRYIAAENHQTLMDNMKLFKEQVMATLFHQQFSLKLIC